ncbi:phosphotransferase [Demequina sp. NBRC 110053]|uniref:phosphotransferase n=1 Tax=Demequina sp. NBRC 110053 TaxID=1570342 RepID=UPI0013562C79|nr:phosphotransferase [Demequina sp. NBRC 110053]
MSEASAGADAVATVMPRGGAPLDTGPPAAHPAISETTARALLDSQLPQFADQELGERFDGWDMAMFRLGGALGVRLPRVESAVDSLEREVRCTTELAHDWTFAYPHVIARGEPGEGYPWPWAVVTWVPGDTADAHPLGASAGQHVGRAIAQIHAPAPGDAWHNPEQSLPFAGRTAETMWALGRVEAGGGHEGRLLDAPAARAMWDAGLAAHEPAEQVWSHADLHGSNLLSDRGEFAGIIDWGKMAACDRAVDLAFLYTAMPQAGVLQAIEAYREATGVIDPGLEARVDAIALQKCLLWANLGRPLNVAMAWRGLAALGVTVAA